jgi:hypothetical protein
MKLQHGSVIRVGEDAPLHVVTKICQGYVRAIPLGGRFDAYSQIFTQWSVVQDMITSEQTQAMLEATDRAPLLAATG